MGHQKFTLLFNILTVPLPVCLDPCLVHGWHPLNTYHLCVMLTEPQHRAVLGCDQDPYSQRIFLNKGKLRHRHMACNSEIPNAKSTFNLENTE